MRVLAIETSAARGSVAVWGPDGALAEATFTEARNHAAELAVRVRAILADLGGLDAVEGYAISIGPGSFTGLRIGVSFLKGLAVIHPRPAIGISTLRVMAVQAVAATRGATGALAIQDARRGEAFAGLYGVDGQVDDRLPDGLYAASTVFAHIPGLADLATTPVAGDRVEAMPPGAVFVGSPVAEPRATTVGRLGRSALEAGAGIDAGALDPAYHQRSAAEVNLGLAAPSDAVLRLEE